MKTVIKRFVTLMVVIVLVVTLAGCEDLLQELEEEDDSTYSGATGTVSGQVVDATTGGGLTGATIRIQNHSQFDTSSATGGYFSIESPTGSQTLVIEMSGYLFGPVTVNVLEGQTTQISTNQTVGNPNITQGGVRAVLTWGSSPRDLDSHLTTPYGQHVYFGNRNPSGAGANLDTDDVSSYGPETITITSGQMGGSYVYWVYNFSGETPLTSSQAAVRLYDSTGLVQTLSVPSFGEGRYWEVFTMTYDGSSYNVSLVNQIRSSSPGS